MSNYPKYSGIGDRITDQQMSQMVKLREQTKKPLTIIVREAVDEYLKRRTKKLNSVLYQLKSLKPTD